MPLLRKSKIAYGAGWRAGMAPGKWITHADGLKRLESPLCPYKGRWQCWLIYQWETGFHDGRMNSFRITNEQRGYRHA